MKLNNAREAQRLVQITLGIVVIILYYIIIYILHYYRGLGGPRDRGLGTKQELGS